MFSVVYWNAMSLRYYFSLKKERKGRKEKDRNFTESYFPATRNSSCVQRILMELKSFRDADRCTLYSHATDTAIGE